jgi:aryl-alcohol dehydrogenase-like predicted oxidoreductase
LTERFSLEALDSDDFRRRHRFSRLDLGPLQAALRAVGRDRGLTAEQAALAWVLRQRGVRAIVGARSEQEASELAGADSWALEDRDLATLELAVRRI